MVKTLRLLVVVALVAAGILMTGAGAAQAKHAKHPRATHPTVTVSVPKGVAATVVLSRGAKKTVIATRAGVTRTVRLPRGRYRIRALPVVVGTHYYASAQDGTAKRLARSLRIRYAAVPHVPATLSVTTLASDQIVLSWPSSSRQVMLRRAHGTQAPATWKQGVAAAAHDTSVAPGEPYAYALFVRIGTRWVRTAQLSVGTPEVDGRGTTWVTDPTADFPAPASVSAAASHGDGSVDVVLDDAQPTIGQTVVIPRSPAAPYGLVGQVDAIAGDGTINLVEAPISEALDAGDFSVTPSLHPLASTVAGARLTKHLAAAPASESDGAPKRGGCEYSYTGQDTESPAAKKKDLADATEKARVAKEDAEEARSKAADAAAKATSAEAARDAAYDKWQDAEQHVSTSTGTPVTHAKWVALAKERKRVWTRATSTAVGKRGVANLLAHKASVAQTAAQDALDAVETAREELAEAEDEEEGGPKLSDMIDVSYTPTWEADPLQISIKKKSVRYLPDIPVGVSVSGGFTAGIDADITVSATASVECEMDFLDIGDTFAVGPVPMAIEVTASGDFSIDGSLKLSGLGFTATEHPTFDATLDGTSLSGGGAIPAPVVEPKTPTFTAEGNLSGKVQGTLSLGVGGATSFMGAELGVRGTFTPLSVDACHVTEWQAGSDPVSRDHATVGGGWEIGLDAHAWLDHVADEDAYWPIPGASGDWTYWKLNDNQDCEIPTDGGGGASSPPDPVSEPPLYRPGGDPDYCFTDPEYADADDPACIVASSQVGDAWTASDGSGQAELTYDHNGCEEIDDAHECVYGGWDTFPGAEAIWRAKDASEAATSATFTKQVDVAGTTTQQCYLQYFADNSISLSVDGTDLLSDDEGTSYTEGTGRLTLTPGSHTFAFTVTNDVAGHEDDDDFANDDPAGLEWKVGDCGDSSYPGTGALTATLTWAGSTDLDLHAVEPSGDELWYAEPGPSTDGGNLDFDANAGCESVMAHPMENIDWGATAESGTYTIWPEVYEDCDDDSEAWHLVIKWQGQTLVDTTGEGDSSGYQITLPSGDVSAVPDVGRVAVSRSAREAARLPK